ncbi:MAG: hypothetical protein LBQ58_10280 [Synergistaceae bacterium]|nr:hypothetical protein [Synergistaceae bacterium]
MSLHAAEKVSPPLVSSDISVISGNAAFENDFRERVSSLDAVVRKFEHGLMMDRQVALENNQLDWREYFYVEKFAFEPGDAWTRIIPSEDKYENLYQQNLLFALDFRTQFVDSLRTRGDAEYKPDEVTSRRNELLIEIEEAQYRVNTWTSERYRSRLYRAESAWNDYLASTLEIVRIFYDGDAALAAIKEIELLEYRLSLLLRQKEALGRLKLEPED